jgi:hypothetical protein
MEYEYIGFDDLLSDPKLPFTKGMLRNFFLKRYENGLAIAVRKIGKRIYVRKDLFIEWIEKHQDKKE